MQLGQRRVPLPERTHFMASRPSMKPLDPTEPRSASHPVTEVWGVVLASWSGMCASEELVLKWETLCFLPLPLSKAAESV